MPTLLKKQPGFRSQDFTQLVEASAVIIDVRSKTEFQNDPVYESINTPLEQIMANVNELRKHEQAIVCCNKGVRTARSKELLNRKGQQNGFNEGCWSNVNKYFKTA